MDFESKYHTKRTMNLDDKDDTYYIDDKTGKMYESPEGGKMIGKLNKNGTIKFSGKFGATLHKHSSGIYYNKEKYVHDWWKKHAEKQSKIAPTRTKDTDQLPCKGYQINRFS